MNTTAAARVETLRGRHAHRRDLDVRPVTAPAGSELYRVSWTHQTLSARGNSEDRRIVYWYGYIADAYIDHGPRKASVIDLVTHTLKGTQ